MSLFGSDSIRILTLAKSELGVSPAHCLREYKSTSRSIGCLHLSQTVIALKLQVSKKRWESSPSPKAEFDTFNMPECLLP
jgi:hypothetical protein